MQTDTKKNNENGTLCKSHITLLRKVASQLAYRQKMNYTQLILGAANQRKIAEAEQLVYDAINILKTIN